MIIDQISIFLENKAGRLAEITQLLTDANINIRALSLADTSDFGILRLILDNTEKASEILKKNNITVRISQVLSIDVDDTPGSLNTALLLLAKNNINIEYMYAFVQQNSTKATLVFRTDCTEKADQILQSI